MKHKKQHFVPQSYLRAWCDPQTPEGHEPYIWLCDKRGGGSKKRAPAKVFTQNDFYTIKDADGERDLVLEHGLSQLEARFSALRRNKLDSGLPLGERDFINLCAFVAAMFARTKSRNDFWREQWQRVLSLAERVEESMKRTPREDLERMSGALESMGGGDDGMTIDDVRGIVEQPVQSFLTSEVQLVTPVLAQMTFTIVETAESPGFVTSDAPCVWFDPELIKKSPQFGAGGLISPSIEISMPLSPRQCILFGHRLLLSGRYMSLKPGDPLVTHFNRRVCHFADEHVVASEDVSDKEWFAGNWC